MKVTVLQKKDNKEERKDYSLIYAVFVLILGIFLTFNAEGFLNIVFDILGGIAILFGIYRLVQFFNMKKELGVEDNNSLMRGIEFVVAGLLVILLSNILTNAVQIVTGVWLIFLGITKLSDAMIWKDIDNKRYSTLIISSILMIGLGIYCLVATNIVLVIIGVILIVYSVISIVDYFNKNKK